MQRTRQQRLTDRRAAYFMELERLQELPAFLAAFAAGYQHDKEQHHHLHRDQLSSEPES